MEEKSLVITRENLIMFWNLILELSNNENKGNLDYAYFVIKNKKVLSEEIELLNEALKDFNKVSEDYKEFLDERNEIIKTFAKKDQDGNLINENNLFIFENENKNRAEERFQNLREKYQDCLNEMAKKESEIVKFLNEEITLNIFILDKGKLPNDLLISPKTLEFLINFEIIV